MTLGEMTWVEVKELLGAGGRVIVLVPVGAVEAHGPHLPLGTDVVIAEGVARRAGEALEKKGWRCVIAPALVYSVTRYARGFQGTVGVGQESAGAYVVDVCDGFGAAGFGRVCLVNAHLEPAHVAVLRRAAEGATRTEVVFADCTERRFARTLTEEFKRGACHAGSYETSLILAERPDLVRASRRDLPPVPIDLAKAMREGVETFEQAGARDAYFGDPAAATIEEGEWIYARLVEMVVAVVSERWPAE